MYNETRGLVTTTVRFLVRNVYIWKTSKLLEDLSQGEMSQWEMTQYLIATTVLWYVLGGVYYDPSDVEIVEWALNLALAAIAAIGIYYCFTVNRKCGNQEFIVKFTILSWPTTVRWVLIGIAAYFLMAIFFRGYLQVATDGFWFELLYQGSLEVVYFWLLSNYIRRAGRNAKEI